MINAVFGSVSVASKVRFDLLFPASALDSGQFFFRHSVPSGKVSCHATTVSPIIDRLFGNVGGSEKTLTCSNFCIYFNP